MRNKILLVICVLSYFFSQSQSITPTPDQIKAITPDWKGERFADGRPKVAEKFLNRLKNNRLSRSLSPAAANENRNKISLSLTITQEPEGFYVHALQTTRVRLGKIERIAGSHISSSLRKQGSMDRPG